MSMFSETLLVGNVVKITNYFNLMHAKPWVHAVSYLVGIFFGWALYESKRNNFKLNKKPVISFWILNAVINLAVVFVLPPYTEDQLPPKPLIIVYGSLQRFFYALALGWTIYACEMGYAGGMNTLLSRRGFVPMSRLNYCLTLINYNFFIMYMAYSRRAFYFNVLDFIQLFFGMQIVLYILSFFVAVTVEVPFSNLYNLVSNRGNTTTGKVDSTIPLAHKMNPMPIDTRS